MKQKIFCVLLAVLLFASIGFALPAKAADTDMTVSQQFLDVLKKWEGFSATPYKDNGQYTFGYGCKCPSDKVDYYTKNPLTQEQAEQLLLEHLAGYEKSVNEFAQRYKLDLLQHQFDALVSFTYNCGGTWLNDKTGYLNTAVREMDMGAGLIYSLGLWGSSSGRYILIQRRMKEANMFLNGVYNTVPDNYGWVYLNGNGGTVSYKIFCFDADLKTVPEVEFKSIPTGIGKDGKPFVYTFAGWYTENGKKVEVLDDTLTRGQTLTARWKDPNGKVVTPSAQQPISQDGFPKTATVVNATNKVNARSGAGSNYVQVGTVAAGSRVTVTEEVIGNPYTIGNASYNIWCKLSDNRYVAKYYLQYDNHKVTSIKVIKQPTVTSYHQPAVNPHLEGSVLKVTYSSGHIEAMTVKKNMVSGFSNKQGEQTITITYGGKTTTMKVKVLPPTAKILGQPKTVYGPAGSTVSTSVKATGHGLKYTWYIKNAGASKYSKSSVTGETYTTKMSDASNGRIVYCVVRDKYGNSVQSKKVSLIRGNTVKLTAPLENGYATEGKTVSVKVNATGDGLQYTWYIKNATASKFTKSSITGAAYSTKMSDAVNGRMVYCVVKDKYGNQVQTDMVCLIQGNPVKLTNSLENAYAAKGKTVSVKVNATGDGLKYTWYIKNAGSSKFGKSSVTGATYSTKMSDAVNGRQVYCVVKDKYGNQVKTDTVKLIQGSPLKLTAAPKDAYALKGKAVTVTVKATGDGLKYTWYIKNAGSSKFGKSSITGATYSIKMSDAVNGRQIYCVIKDKHGNSVRTDTVKLIQGSPLKLTESLKDASATKGKAVSVKVNATGDGLKYTWYIKNAGSSKFGKSSVTGAKYSVLMNEKSNGRTVYCVIRDKHGNSVQTNKVVLKMK